MYDKKKFLENIYKTPLHLLFEPKHAFLSPENSTIEFKEKLKLDILFIMRINI